MNTGKKKEIMEIMVITAKKQRSLSSILIYQNSSGRCITPRLTSKIIHKLHLAAWMPDVFSTQNLVFGI